MYFKLIVGVEPLLSLAEYHWRLVDPSLSIVKVQLNFHKNYSFDYSVLASYSASEATAFIAWDSSFLNFQRWDIFGEIKRRGFKTPPLIHPSAIIGTDTKAGENTWVNEFVSIGPSCTIGACVHIGAGTIVGTSTVIKNCAWVANKASIGSCCEIGQNSILAPDSILRNGISIGRNCNLEDLNLITKNIPNGSFHLNSSSLKGSIIDLS